MVGDDLTYLTVADVLTIHDFIVESSPETTAGVSSRGDVEYVLEHVRVGLVAQQPLSLHEKGY